MDGPEPIRRTESTLGAIDGSLVVGLAVLFKAGSDMVPRAVQRCLGDAGNAPWEWCAVDDAMVGVLVACLEALHNVPATKVDEIKTAVMRLRSSIMLREVAARRLKQTAAPRPQGQQHQRNSCVIATCVLVRKIK